MRVIDENTITDAALEQMSATPNPRLKEIMASLVRHLHDFAREVDLTPGRVARRNQVSHRGRPEVHRAPPGIHSCSPTRWA